MGVSVDLKRGDFSESFDLAAQFEVVIEYKKGGTPKDFVSPLDTIGIDGEYLRVTNHISEYCYKYLLKDLKSVMIIPTEFSF
jgi:hypothetical protein